ncbi:MAG: 4-hydroxy-tetrahydrodipicolinate synthase [Dokdonella sp.]
MKLGGSICALATLFDPAGESLDLEAFARLVDSQIDAGTNALVVAGSTGEGAALEPNEFVSLLECALHRSDRRLAILAGTGMQSTRKTIAQTRLAASVGADAALVVVPAYVRPTQEGLYQHFSEVAEHGGLPIMLYNVPSRSACDLLPETVERLRDRVGVIGIKEAVPSIERMLSLTALRGDRFQVFSGDDPTSARAIRAGADGVVSVAANLVPTMMQTLCERAARGVDTAGLEDRLQPLHELLAIEPNPIPLKWCLSQIGLGCPSLRLPMTTLAAIHHSRAANVLVVLGLLEAARASG